jgi:hypothetical protein
MLDAGGDDVIAPLAVAKNTPLRARLLASLPPLVKTISPLRQPSNAATWARAVSRATFAAAAAQCPLDGLPK